MQQTNNRYLPETNNNNSNWPVCFFSITLYIVLNYWELGVQRGHIHILKIKIWGLESEEKSVAFLLIVSLVLQLLCNKNLNGCTQIQALHTAQVGLIYI